MLLGKISLTLNVFFGALDIRTPVIQVFQFYGRFLREHDFFYLKV